jgi:RHS repeat-associated protein
MAGTTYNPYRFGGQVGYRRDGASRQYVRARHLDTNKGRWVSKDPIGFDAGDSNLYRYVGNQPTSETDPAGLAPIRHAPVLKGPPFVWDPSYWNDPNNIIESNCYCYAMNRPGNQYRGQNPGGFSGYQMADPAKSISQ